MPSRHIIVAGGGASGLLVSIALIAGGSSVTVIEPRTRLGVGVAYSTTCPLHLLNVPSSGMSGFPDDPDHFVRWLACEGERADRAAFVPRMLYGRYLDHIAATMRAAAGPRFTHVHTTAIDCENVGAGVRVTCADGTMLTGDAFVVAVGNAAPASWPALDDDVLTSQRYFRSAWTAGAFAPDDAGETVVLLGTGLTAIDATLGLRHNGHRGEIVMLSRRGLLPHEHRVFDAPPPSAPDAEGIRDVIAAVRRAAPATRTERGWRGAIDGLRSETNARWQSLSLEEQRRLVRHALPYWNVHRHRVAPEAAKTIAELIAANTLRMIAGRTERIERSGDALTLSVRLRGTSETTRIAAGRIINCSGPQHNIAELPNPLLRRLIERGTIVPTALKIGAQVAADGAFIDAVGRPSTQLYAIGPVRFGTLIETTAIPEIRAQAQALAATLATAVTPSIVEGQPQSSSLER